MVADRMTQLDQMTRGRVILGVGPGALVSDAMMFGIKTVDQRRRVQQSVEVIMRLLRGETAHFDYVSSEVARGVQLAQLDTGIPIIFCVLTCDTLEQAIDRAGLKSGNKGYEAGLAAVEMANLAKRLRAASA